jgi:hypothetical protein
MGRHAKGARALGRGMALTGRCTGGSFSNRTATPPADNASTCDYMLPALDCNAVTGAPHGLDCEAPRAAARLAAHIATCGECGRGASPTSDRHLADLAAGRGASNAALLDG